MKIAEFVSKLIEATESGKALWFKADLPLSFKTVIQGYSVYVYLAESILQHDAFRHILRISDHTGAILEECDDQCFALYSETNKKETRHLRIIDLYNVARCSSNDMFAVIDTMMSSLK